MNSSPWSGPKPFSLGPTGNLCEPTNNVVISTFVTFMMIDYCGVYDDDDEDISVALIWEVVQACWYSALFNKFNNFLL